MSIFNHLYIQYFQATKAKQNQRLFAFAPSKSPNHLRQLRDLRGKPWPQGMVYGMVRALRLFSMALELENRQMNLIFVTKQSAMLAAACWWKGSAPQKKLQEITSDHLTEKTLDKSTIKHQNRRSAVWGSLLWAKHVSVAPAKAGCAWQRM